MSRRKATNFTGLDFFRHANEQVRNDQKDKSYRTSLDPAEAKKLASRRCWKYERFQNWLDAVKIAHQKMGQEVVKADKRNKKVETIPSGAAPYRDSMTIQEHEDIEAKGFEKPEPLKFKAFECEFCDGWHVFATTIDPKTGEEIPRNASRAYQKNHKLNPNRATDTTSK